MKSIFTLSFIFLLATPLAAGDYWALAPGNLRPLQPAVFESPKVKGISLRMRWEHIEPQKGQFDWSFLDKQIARCKRAKKPYMLRIVGGRTAPDWATTRKHNGFPVEWDSTYLDNFENMIRVVGRRYGDDSDLMVVHMTGPCGGGEFYLNQGVWNLPDYSSRKIRDAWKRVTVVYRDSFPKRVGLCYNASRIAPRGNPHQDVEDVVNQGKQLLGRRMIVQLNSFSAKTSASWWLYQIVVRSPRYGWQDVSPSINRKRFGGSFAQSLPKQGPKWEHREFYQGDLKYLP